MASDPHPDAPVSAVCDLDVSIHGTTSEWLRTEDDGSASFQHAGTQSERAGEPSITLEPVTPDDEPFMFAVYSSTRTDELALTGWPASMQEQFLRMQFIAQTYSYRMQFPEAQYSVIHCNGVAAGRLIVNRTDQEIHVVDIAVITEHRGNKIGSRLMGWLLEEANRASKTVRLHVERVNPALRWYEKLGFKSVSASDIYLEMVYRPNVAGAAE